jgi:protein O-mannosyl-transferase
MSSRRHLIILGLFILGGFLAYANILNSYFLSDDFAQIGKVLGGDFSVVWGKAHGGFFRPLFILSYIIDSKIWQAHALGFHLTNVAIHSLNAFLTFILATRMLGYLQLTARTSKAIAILAGVLFLLHPSHTEAVSWISGRADLIATFFCLASLCAYLAYVQSRRPAQLILSLACFALALLAKESAICLPFLAGAVGLYAGEMRRTRSRWRFPACIATYISMLLVFVAVRSAFIGSLVGGYGASQHLNFSPTWLRDRLLEASVRSVLPVLPNQLSRFVFKPLQSPAFILFALVCAAATALVIILRRRRLAAAERAAQNKFMITLAGLFLISLLPVINLRLTLYQTLGERFLYLPTVFSCLLIAYLVPTLIRRPAVWLPVMFCIVGFYSVRLYQTNQIWREAAALSSNIKDQLADSAMGDRLLIINAPDNLRGVPVFHNGLPEALEYFQSRRKFTQVEVLAFQELESAFDDVEVNRRPGFLTLRLITGARAFERVEPVACLEIMGQSKTSLELHARPCLDGTQVFFFSKGRMTPLLQELDLSR